MEFGYLIMMMMMIILIIIVMQLDAAAIGVLASIDATIDDVVVVVVDWLNKNTNIERNNLRRAKFNWLHGKLGGKNEAKDTR